MIVPVSTCTSSVAWSPTRFDEEGLKEIVSKFFGTLRNVYNFFVLYSNQDEITLDVLGVDEKGDPKENGNYVKPFDRPELDRHVRISVENRCRFVCR